MKSLASFFFFLSLCTGLTSATSTHSSLEDQSTLYIRWSIPKAHHSFGDFSTKDGVIAKLVRRASPPGGGKGGGGGKPPLPPPPPSPARRQPGNQREGGRLNPATGSGEGGGRGRSTRPQEFAAATNTQARGGGTPATRLRTDRGRVPGGTYGGGVTKPTAMRPGPAAGPNLHAIVSGANFPNRALAMGRQEARAGAWPGQGHNSAFVPGRPGRLGPLPPPGFGQGQGGFAGMFGGPGTEHMANAANAYVAAAGRGQNQIRLGPAQAGQRLAPGRHIIAPASRFVFGSQGGVAGGGAGGGAGAPFSGAFGGGMPQQGIRPGAGGHFPAGGFGGAGAMFGQQGPRPGAGGQFMAPPPGAMFGQQGGRDRGGGQFPFGPQGRGFAAQGVRPQGGPATGPLGGAWELGAAAGGTARGGGRGDGGGRGAGGGWPLLGHQGMPPPTPESSVGSNNPPQNPQG